MKISEIINKNIFAEFFLFFNTNFIDEKKIMSTISYRDSKFAEIELDQEIYLKNNELMNDYFGLNFEFIGKSHRLEIDNDLNLDSEKYYRTLYNNILVYMYKQKKNKSNELLFSSLFVPRGSIDISRNYFSIDIFEDTLKTVPEYIKYLSSIIISTNAIKQFNFNFRNFQPEYISGETKRNPQLRINLRWFYDRYLDNVKNINIYKYNILRAQSHIIEEKSEVVNYNNTSIERILFFYEKVLNKNLIESDIKKLREELNFSTEETCESRVYRNREIVILAQATLDDECVGCKDIYNIKDRSFKLRKNNKWYLEIHHVIPYYNDKDNNDVIENLVKLCPTCHSALTKNRAHEDLQKFIIKNILKNSNTPKQYVSLISGHTETDDLVDFIYERL